MSNQTTESQVLSPHNPWEKHNFDQKKKKNRNTLQS